MLKSILTFAICVYALYALLKFCFFAILGYDRRRKLLDTSYGGRASATRISDYLLLFIAIGLSVMLAVAGADQVSFLTGLLVGMTLIQIYFHQFSRPLAEDRLPKPPVSPIKMMSYAIQAEPGRPWKEMLVIATLLIWSLAVIVAPLAGWR
jgi:hypothetical protein